MSDLWHRWLYRVFAVISLIVFLSGCWLVFFYQPVSAQAWNDISTLGSGPTFASLFRLLHLWSVVIWLLLLIAVAAAELVRRRILGGLIITAAIIGAVVVTFIGLQLPWDQLALWDITVGSNNGYLPVLFGDDIRFIIVNDSAVELSTLRTYLYLHIALGTFILIVIPQQLHVPLRHYRLPYFEA